MKLALWRRFIQSWAEGLQLPETWWSKVACGPEATTAMVTVRNIDIRRSAVRMRRCRAAVPCGDHGLGY
jgi:hypothetical protein